MFIVYIIENLMLIANTIFFKKNKNWEREHNHWKSSLVTLAQLDNGYIYVMGLQVSMETIFKFVLLILGYLHLRW